MSNALCVSFYPFVFRNQEETMFPRNQMSPEKCDIWVQHDSNSPLMNEDWLSMEESFRHSHKHINLTTTKVAKYLAHETPSRLRMHWQLMAAGGGGESVFFRDVGFDSLPIF